MEEIKSKLRKRAREEVTPVPTLYNEALVELSTQPDRSDVAPTLPTYSSFKSSMYRSRRKRLPPLPKTRAEIDLTGDWVNSLSGERSRNEGSSDRILIFSTDAMLRLLCDLEALYVDGTFQVCPSMFMQLFTINGFVSGQQFPLVYALLPSKSRADYNRMFTYLKEELQNRGLQMSPQSVMADFELAVIQSLEMQLPGVEIQGCYFHFSQCLWRKVQALGMADLYKNDADTRNFIHKAAALPFIPPRFIRIAWTLVESEAPKTSKADEFIRYF